MEIRENQTKKTTKTWLKTSTAAGDGKAGCWLHAPVVQGKDAAAEVTGLNSVTNAGLTMHGFQGALFSFLWFYFLFFILLYFFVVFLFNFCVLATPRRTVCFWFLPLRLHGKFSFSFFRDGNIQILYIHLLLFFFSLLIMLLVIYCRVWGQTKRVAVTRSLQALWINLWVKRG